jgi:hypothetical protein
VYGHACGALRWPAIWRKLCCHRREDSLRMHRERPAAAAATLRSWLTKPSNGLGACLGEARLRVRRNRQGPSPRLGATGWMKSWRQRLQQPRRWHPAWKK